VQWLGRRCQLYSTNHSNLMCWPFADYFLVVGPTSARPLQISPVCWRWADMCVLSGNPRINKKSIYPCLLQISGPWPESAGIWVQIWHRNLGPHKHNDKGPVAEAYRNIRCNPHNCFSSVWRGLWSSFRIILMRLGSWFLSTCIQHQGSSPWHLRQSLWGSMVPFSWSELSTN